MNYNEIKTYIIDKYADKFENQEMGLLFTSVENLYLSKTSPFDLSATFDAENSRATSWVVRAVSKIAEDGDFDITSYSENGLSIKLGESMLAELTPFAGVGGNNV